jgi:hypothetical protein
MPCVFPAHFLVDPARRQQPRQESQVSDKSEASTEKDEETTVAATG